MTTVCLHVKPSAADPGIGLMSVTLLGPKWAGDRLRLLRWSELGLTQSDLVGWSDFYGGGPCQVQVAFATNGQRAGYLVWGGNLGLRVVPATVPKLDRRMGQSLAARSVIWIEDATTLPGEVRQLVTPAAAVSLPIPTAPRDGYGNRYGGGHGDGFGEGIGEGKTELLVR